MNLFNQMLIYALLACLATTLGSSLVFIFKTNKKITMDIFLSIAAGIMLSSSIFSLLIPSINYLNNYLLLSISILMGSFFIILLSRITLNNNKTNSNLLLILSIMFHNIPEGASIGICFGSLLLGNDTTAAISFALGIALQNIPEGASISIPLKLNGYSKFKSFIIGFISGLIEVISAIIGFIFVSYFTNILPFILSFAAGTMIFVIISEMIPESINEKNKLITSICFILGFIFMIILEGIL